MIRLITIYISVYIFKTHPVPEHLTFARDLANDDRSCGMFEANQPEHIHVRYGTNDSVSVCAASWG